jgi:hypothetical protein
MIVSSPNLALFHSPPPPGTPSPSPTKSHDRVVCSCLGRFSKTDRTFGFSASEPKKKKKKKSHSQPYEKNRTNEKFRETYKQYSSLSISAASSSLRFAAKPLIFLVYE